MESCIERVQDKMKAIDLELKNVYYPQSLKDIDRFAMDSKKVRLSNHNFSCNLYHELSTKYFWRGWLVVAQLTQNAAVTHTPGYVTESSNQCTEQKISSLQCRA